MYRDLVNPWLHLIGGKPCFRIYGKGKPEADWREILVYASRRRDEDSRWPLWRGTCTTWSAEVIAVGWDFAATLVREQFLFPASRQYPVAVSGERLGDPVPRRRAGAPPCPSASEILAHECGHTWQALCLGAWYLPLVGAVTLFREGPHPWNHFENQASALGLFGGLVNYSVCPELMRRDDHLIPANNRA